MRRTSYILPCLLGLCIGLLIGQKMNGRGETTEIIITDTLTKIKYVTLKYDDPTLIDVRFDLSLPVILPLQPFDPKNFKFDFINKHAEVCLFKREIKTYKDSSYTAQISGYNVNLDWIETYTKEVVKEVYITEKVYQKPKRWLLGAFIDAKYYDRVYLPIGGRLSYFNDKWEITGKVGKDIISNAVIGEVGVSWNFAF